MLTQHMFAPDYYYGLDPYLSERRRAAEADYRLQRQWELEMRRRQAYEQEMARQRMLAYERERAEQEQRERYLNALGRVPNNMAGYTIVRGPDGRLYRVPLESCTKQPKQESCFKMNDQPRDVSHRESSLSTSLPVAGYSTTRTPAANSACASTFDGESSADYETALETKASNQPFLLNKRSSKSRNERSNLGAAFALTQKRNSSVGQVLVEDASDSEDEKDEYRSVFRNRRPSPGQSWMEPIDAIK
jgi:hypothetical protein